MKPFSAALNVLRGGLIGLAEVVPGVSGGTVALVVGVYQTVISSAAYFSRGLFAAVRGDLAALRRDWARVRWAVLLPLGLGMLVGIVAGAAVLEPLIEAEPTVVRAVFAGLILASLWVPFRMAGSWSPGMLALAVAAAVGMFFLAGVPSLQTPDPSLWLVAPAAALAVCALVLPGVSGSFLLVILGLYEPTLAAVNDRDVAYLGVFVLGAIVGLALFVRVVQYLLTTFRALTLSLMTGLMAGSLRALWPWQGEERDLIAPGEDAGSVVLATVIAMAFVITLLVAERYLSPRVNSVSQGSSE